MSGNTNSRDKMKQNKWSGNIAKRYAEVRRSKRYESNPATPSQKILLSDCLKMDRLCRYVMLCGYLDATKMLKVMKCERDDIESLED